MTIEELDNRLDDLGNMVDAMKSVVTEMVSDVAEMKLEIRALKNSISGDPVFTLKTCSKCFKTSRVHESSSCCPYCNYGFLSLTEPTTDPPPVTDLTPTTLPPPALDTIHGAECPGCRRVFLTDNIGKSCPKCFKILVPKGTD